MSKKLKYSIIIFSIALGLLILLLCASLLLLNPNNYKDQLSELIEKNTGQKINILGDISLSFFPSLNFNTEEIQILNPTGFKEPYFASLKNINIYLKILPLFSGIIQIDSLKINQLELILVEMDSNKKNWEELIKNKKQNSSSAPLEQSKITQNVNEQNQAEQNQKELNLSLSDKLTFDIAIDELVIQNSKLVYFNIPKNSTYQFTGFNSLIKGLKDKNNIELELSTDYNFSSGLANGSIQFGAVIQPELNNKIKINNFNADVSIISQNLNKEGLKLQSIAELELNTLTTDFDLKNISITSLNNYLKLNGQGNILSQKFLGNLELKTIPQELLSIFKINLNSEPDNCFKLFELTADIKIQHLDLSLNNINSSFDESQIKGNLNYSGLNKNNKISLTLNVSKLNLDNYLKIINRTEQKKLNANQENSSANNLNPSSNSTAMLKEEVVKDNKTKPLNTASSHRVLQENSGNALITIDELTVNKMNLSKVKANILNQQGLIRISPLTFKLFHGDFAFDLTTDCLNKNKTKQLIASVRNLNLAETLKNLADVAGLTGTAHLNAELTSLGENEQELRQNLAGKVLLAMHDGQIKNWNLLKINKDLPPLTLTGSIQSLTASFVGTQGIFNNKDLLIKSSLAKINGKGNINLSNYTLDYLASVQAAQINIPVGIGGSLFKPSIKINALTILAEDQLKENLNIGKDFLKQNKEPLKTLENELKNIFKKKKN